MIKINVQRADRARRRKLLTQGALAEEAGLSPNTVSAAFAGKAVSVRTAVKLAAALGVKPKTLVLLNDPLVEANTGTAAGTEKGAVSALVGGGFLDGNDDREGANGGDGGVVARKAM